MRIRTPKDFWSLFKTKGGKVAVGGNELWSHYAKLLHDAEKPEKVEPDISKDRVLNTQWTGEMVEEAAKEMKNNKSRGSSFICNKLLSKSSMKNFYESIACVMNACRRSGLPESWNTLEIVSLHKGKNLPRNVAGSYRGIAIM